MIWWNCLQLASTLTFRAGMLGSGEFSWVIGEIE